MGSSLISGQQNHPEFLPPAEFSYEGVPGFAPQPDYPLLEWDTVSRQENDEPRVVASVEPPAGLRLRWLGAAGFEISDDSTTLLVDPFVSRSTRPKLLGKIEIDTAAVDYYILAPMQKENLRAILVSHNHYDHVEDVPYILAQYPDAGSRPLVVGDPNVTRLITTYRVGIGIPWVDSAGGLENSRTLILDLSEPSPTASVGQFGRFEITALLSVHPPYGRFPWRGPEGRMRELPPTRMLDYKSYRNASVGYLINYNGFRIFFSESPIVLHADQVGPVDVLIQGIASRKGENTIAATLSALHPSYVVPSHYDNLFKPLTKFHHFDYKIGLRLNFPGAEGASHTLLDFSQFDKFLSDFDTHFVREAGENLPEEDVPFQPKLRLMKLLYYYSLEQLRNATSTP